MKKEDAHIVVFSTYEQEGGAAWVCYNKVKRLREHGFDAIEVVRHKAGSDEFVYQVSESRRYRLKKALPLISTKLDRWLSKDNFKQYTNGDYYFLGDDLNTAGMCSAEEIIKLVPFTPTLVIVGHSFDLVNTKVLVELHKTWGCQILLGCVDVGAYTAGCHVHLDCDSYTRGCTDCPAVWKEDKKKDVENFFKQKRANIVAGNFGISCPNNWLKHEIEKGGLFKGQLIYYGSQSTDTELFNPNNRDIAKRIFGIDAGKRVIMTGSTYLNEKRKGVIYYVKALQLLWDKLTETERKKICVMVVGKNEHAVADLLGQLPPFEVKVVPYLKDMRLLSLAYQASDMYVCTSLEDAGPSMVTDAMACGTPIVGFKTGFLADEEISKEGETGFYCEIRDTEGLAEGLRKMVTATPKMWKSYSENCRTIAETKLSMDYSISLLEKFIENQ